MLEICSLSVLESYMKNCLYMFLCMAVKQRYGRRRRDLELRLYTWTTSEACLVLGGWIVSNAWIREFSGVKKRIDERTDEDVLQWFGHEERMERDRIAKRIYVGEWAGSRSDYVLRGEKEQIETRVAELDENYPTPTLSFS